MCCWVLLLLGGPGGRPDVNGAECEQGCIKVVRKSSLTVRCDFPTIIKSDLKSISWRQFKFLDHRILLNKLETWAGQNRTVKMIQVLLVRAELF